MPTGGRPLLSGTWVCTQAQLKLFSLGLPHRLADNDDYDDEDGEQDQDAADGDGDHCTVTH